MYKKGKNGHFSMYSSYKRYLSEGTMSGFPQYHLHILLSCCRILCCLDENFPSYEKNLTVFLKYSSTGRNLTACKCWWIGPLRGEDKQFYVMKGVMLSGDPQDESINIDWQKKLLPKTPSGNELRWLHYHQRITISVQHSYYSHRASFLHIPLFKS